MKLCDCNQGRTPCTCRDIPPSLAQFSVEERGELLARIAELEAEAVYAAAGFAAARAELAMLKAHPSAGVVLPELKETESGEYGDAYRRGFIAYGREFARLNPCRAQSVPDGYVMVPIGLAHILMAPNARPLTARDARNALRAIVDSAAPSAQQEESDDE